MRVYEYPVDRILRSSASARHARSSITMQDLRTVDLGGLAAAALQPPTSIRWPDVLISARAEYVVFSDFEGTMMTAVMSRNRKCNFHDFSTSTSKAHFLLQPELQLQLRNFRKIITSPDPARRVLQHGTLKLTPTDVSGAC